MTGRARPLMTQDVRAIDWDSDCTDTVLRKIRAGEGHPGVLDSIQGTEFHLFGVHRERVLRGRPGETDRAARRCDLSSDRRRRGLDHPPQAARQHERSVLQAAGRVRACARRPRPDVPEISVAVHERLPADHTYREIAYEERAAVGYLHFDFYNGAMSTDQCRRLRDAYTYARSRSADQGDRADGRPRLFLKWHPSERDRGRRETRPRSPGATSTRSTTSSGRSSRPTRIS